MTEPISMWWPSVEALDELIVEESGDGFTLSAPEDSECQQWLNHFSQSEEHLKVFNDAFMAVILSYANLVLNSNGEAENVPDEQSDHRVETEENGSGSVS